MSVKEIDDLLESLMKLSEKVDDTNIRKHINYAIKGIDNERSAIEKKNEDLAKKK